jgi:hypothetical protein
MARDNGLCVCVVKPHGVSDKPLQEAALQKPWAHYMRTGRVWTDVTGLTQARDACGGWAWIVHLDLKSRQHASHRDLGSRWQASQKARGQAWHPGLEHRKYGARAEWVGS